MKWFLFGLVIGAWIGFYAGQIMAHWQMHRIEMGGYV